MQQVKNSITFVQRLFYIFGQISRGEVRRLIIS